MLKSYFFACNRCARTDCGSFWCRALHLIGLPGSTAWSQQPKDIKWGTGPVGSSGHKALVVLADVLNKAMPEIRITVLPYPGAVGTVKGFATGDIDGYYGSDVALKELAERQRPLQGLQGAGQSPAGAIVLVLHARRRHRHQGERPRHHQELGRPHRQERLYRPAALRHPHASRKRVACDRRQAHLQAGRPVDRRLAAQLRLDQGHDHLCRRRRDAGAVDRRSLARGRLGGAQSERRRNSPRSRRRASPAKKSTRRTSTKEPTTCRRSRCCPSTGASTSA